MLKYKVVWVLLIAMLFGAICCWSIDWESYKIKRQFTEGQWRDIRQMAQQIEFKKDVSNRVSGDPQAVLLGEKFFYSKELSSNGKVACISCHLPEKNWTDGRKLAKGVKDGTRNSLSLWNASHNRWFFWDGRADSQWSQALEPLESSLEMGNTRLAILHTIKEISDFRRTYEKVFRTSLGFLDDTLSFPKTGGPKVEYGKHNAWTEMRRADQVLVNQHFANVGKAIAAFEETIITKPSDFDVFVKDVEANRKVAYPEPALKGLKLFVGKAKCINCHSGQLFSNKEFHNIRLSGQDGGRYEGIRKIMASEFNQNGQYSDDQSISKIEYLKLVKRNWGEIKVPSLRKVAFTAPYMHDGRFASLRDVIDYYSELKEAIPHEHINETLIRPLNLNEEEKISLIAFLKTI